MSNQILETGPISRVRRNHALEHATLQILAGKNPRLRAAGYSDPGGFWVLGDIDTQDLQLAVDEALARLNAGESSLAIHPNCGTNFAVSGLFAGLAAWIAMLGSGRGLRSKLDHLPMVVTFSTLALIFAHPLGPLVQQRITTDARPNGLKISAIMYLERQGMPAHRVKTYDAT
jgi:hypothetical protein